MRTRIKFCGMTRPGDVRLAAELGVDAIGFVFVPGSKREVTIDQAAALREAVPLLISTVALVMNSDAQQVESIIRRVRPEVLQFHGDEDDAFCSQFRLPFIKTIAMGGLSSQQGSEKILRYPNASAILLDGHAQGVQGGSGQVFDWQKTPNSRASLWLAGGLTADNVATAIQQAQPFAVDVSSGIETSPGVKDGRKMQQFIAAVRAADQS
jgi:phosphoribosylanthranilate isomerase